VNNTIPTEVHLYYAKPENMSQGYLTVHHNKGLDNCGGYTWLGSAPVDFGEVIFDEKEIMLKALHKELGEAQGKVNFIKDRIQELLALGHEV